MGEIRIVGPGKTRGYPYPVCKKTIVGPGKTRGYPYPVCKKVMMPISDPRDRFFYPHRTPMKDTYNVNYGKLEVFPLVINPSNKRA